MLPTDWAALPAALAQLHLAQPCPVLAVVGAADSLDPALNAPLAALLTETCAPLLTRLAAVAVDGGTDAGVMALLGQARQRRGGFPLLGVAARGTVRLPGESGSGAALEPNHSHFVLAPGQCWGDETPWLAESASLLAKGCGQATLVIGGGSVTARDIAASLAAGRPTVLLAGSGGAAERQIAQAVAEPLCHVAALDDGAGLARLLGALLSRC